MHPCTYPTKNGSYRADCGTLVVPEDRADPRSRLIALPVTRILARSSHPLAPIFHLNGGPGITNMTFPQANRLAAQHDVVMVGCRAFTVLGLNVPSDGGAETSQTLGPSREAGVSLRRPARLRAPQRWTDPACFPARCRAPVPWARHAGCAGRVFKARVAQNRGLDLGTGVDHDIPRVVVHQPDGQRGTQLAAPGRGPLVRVQPLGHHVEFHFSHGALNPSSTRSFTSAGS